MRIWDVPSRDPEPQVRDNEVAHRYEIGVGGEQGVLNYRRAPRTIDLLHTEVPPELRGRGLAKILAAAALDAARAEGLRVIPSCPFVRDYIQKHPEYAPLVRK